MKTLHDRISDINPIRARLILITNALLIPAFSIAAICCAANIYENPYRASLNNASPTMQALCYIFGTLALLSVLLLRELQDGVYWPTWAQFKRPGLDKRQQKIRSRVYESAYPIATLGLFLAFTLLMFGKVRHYTDYARGNLIDTALFMLLLICLALPSILAAFQKDS